MLGWRSTEGHRQYPLGRNFRLDQRKGEVEKKVRRRALATNELATGAYWCRVLCYFLRRIKLLVKRGDEYGTVSLNYHGGIHFPDGLRIDSYERVCRQGRSGYGHNWDRARDRGALCTRRRSGDGLRY